MLVSSNLAFIFRPVLIHFWNMRQFLGVPPHSQCLKGQSSNNGSPSTASNRSSREISSGGFAVNTGLYDETLSLPLTDFHIVDIPWPVVSNARVGVFQNAEGAYRFDFAKAYTLYDSDPDNDQDPVSSISLPSENYYLSQNIILEG